MLDIPCQEIYSSSDYIEIRDGSSQDAPVIGRFCGNGDNLPESLYSTKNYLQIRLENYWKPQQRLPTLFFDLGLYPTSSRVVKDSRLNIPPQT